eukprot:129581-Chlamydomonas_euryale.AAC.3
MPLAPVPHSPPFIRARCPHIHPSIHPVSHERFMVAPPHPTSHTCASTWMSLSASSFADLCSESSARRIASTLSPVALTAADNERAAVCSVPAAWPLARATDSAPVAASRR